MFFGFSGKFLEICQKIFREIFFWKSYITNAINNQGRMEPEAEVFL